MAYFDRNGLSIATEALYNEVLANKCTIEAPAALGAGISTFGVKFFGAYSFCRGGSFAGVERIGRFCSLATGIVMGPVEHDPRLLTTSTFLSSALWRNAEGWQEYWNKNHAERQAILQRIRAPECRNRQTITIGNDVWVAQNVLIRRGVTVGNGAVVGANSVVSRDVQPYEIVAGAPARHIRYRFSAEQIEVLERVCWWHWSLESLHGITWTDPENACRELDHRYTSGNVVLTAYKTLADLIA